MLGALEFKIFCSEFRQLHFLRFLLRKFLVSLGTQILNYLLMEEKLRRVVCLFVGSKRYKQLIHILFLRKHNNRRFEVFEIIYIK